MNKDFQNICVCIWDFDGTLYKSRPEFSDAIRAKEIQVIMRHTGWSEDKAKEEFYKIFKQKTPSGTRVVSLLTGIGNTQASVETSDNDFYISLYKDPMLSNMFLSLQRLTHYLLVNGSRGSAARGLHILGLNPAIFTEVVTSETVGETKPSPKGFLYIMHKTGLPAISHMMIGDREAVDLAPAKALGMKTCLVWSGPKSNIADIALRSVYEVADVLG